MFLNRGEAGKKLARELKKYKNKPVLVLGLLRGGVEVGYHVARYLNSPFSILITRKLVYPNNPEAAFGSIAEDGSVYLADFATKDLTRETIDEIVTDQLDQIDQLQKKLRNGNPLPRLNQKIVILVSDGIINTLNFQVAFKLCKKHEAKEIILSAPLADRDIADHIRTLIPKLIVLETCRHCHSVDKGYLEYPNLTNDDLKQILDRWEMEYRNNID